MTRIEVKIQDPDKVKTWVAEVDAWDLDLDSITEMFEGLLKAIGYNDVDSRIQEQD